MDALAGQRVQVSRQSGHKGLALAGLHLGDVAPVEGDAAGELHREVLHVQHAPGSFPADGESIGQDIVQRFAVGQPLLQRGGLGLQLGIGHGLILRLQRQNFFHDRVDLFQLFVRKSTEESFSKGHW